MAARFQRDVIAARPDIVTISVGVNDVWHAFYDFTAGKPILEGNGPNGVPIVTYRKKVDEMIRAAKSAGIRPILLSATMVYENFSGPENARIVEYNRSLQALARHHAISYVDLFGVFRKTILEYQKHAGTRVNLVTSDGVHLNPAGNQLMAYTILKALGVSDNSLADARASVDSSLKTERP
jgi:lysophospholipase L1-like esterase